MQSIKNSLGRLACALAIALIAVSASADGAPTSQFGFKGWPYLKQRALRRGRPAGLRQRRGPRRRPRYRPLRQLPLTLGIILRFRSQRKSILHGI